jgi:FkbM family methyltransferase
LKNYRQVAARSLPEKTLNFRAGMSFAAFDVDTALQVFDEVFVQETYQFSSPSTKKVILDVGANIGLFSLYAYLKAPSAQIYCVEASPTTFRTLDRNVNRNGLFNNIHAFCNAIGSQVGSATFYETEVSGWSSLYANRGAENGSPIEVEMKTLATFCSEHNIAAIDYLKMDIEGAEYSTILDAPDFFSVPAQTAVIEVDREPRGGKHTFTQLIDALDTHYHKLQVIESRDPAYPLVYCTNPR